MTRNLQPWMIWAGVAALVVVSITIGAIIGNAGDDPPAEVAAGADHQPVEAGPGNVQEDGGQAAPAVEPPTPTPTPTPTPAPTPSREETEVTPDPTPTPVADVRFAPRPAGTAGTAGVIDDGEMALEEIRSVGGALAALALRVEQLEAELAAAEFSAAGGDIPALIAQHLDAERVQRQAEWEAILTSATQRVLESRDVDYEAAIRELAETARRMEAAYVEALAKTPPVPPSIQFLQAPIPRPAVPWSLVLEPGLYQTRAGYGRVVVENIAEADVDRVLHIERVAIGKRGRMNGVPHVFPSERHWASMAVRLVPRQAGGQAVAVGPGVFFEPQTPVSGVVPCHDVAVYTSIDGAEWTEAATGCAPRVAIAGATVVAVAVDVQRSY